MVRKHSLILIKVILPIHTMRPREKEDRLLKGVEIRIKLSSVIIETKNNRPRYNLNHYVEYVEKSSNRKLIADGLLNHYFFLF